jgi:hypothetical protein
MFEPQVYVLRIGSAVSGISNNLGWEALIAFFGIDL